MPKFVRVVAVFGCVAGSVAIGMTASAWASPTKPDWASGAPHTLATGRPMVASTDAIFHAIPGCRIVNTTVAGGSFPNGTTRHYYVGGTTGFTAQGGSSSGCDIPVGATAITATFSAVNGSDAGYLRAWANGSTEPTATVLTYPKTTSVTAGTTVAIGTSALALAVKNYHGPVNLIIDVTGYYRPQINGLIGPNEVASGSTRIVSATTVSTGVYTVVTDTNLVNCTPVVSAFGTAGTHVSADNLGGNAVRIYIWLYSGGTIVPVSLHVHFLEVC